MTDEKLLAEIAADLVQMHVETGIDLAHWPTALKIVQKFYHTRTDLTIVGHRKDIADKAKHEKQKWSKYENQKCKPGNNNPHC